MYDDSLIISLLQKRDEQALQMIREQYGGFCFQIAYRMTGNREDAEECVSDMLMDVWNSVPPHQPVHLQAYLASLVRRSAIDKYQKEHRIKRGGKQIAAALDELAEILPSAENVESVYSSKLLTAAIQSYLDTLSAQARRVFLQRYLLAMPLQEIARENGMSLSAVKVTLHRTRKQIQEYLRKEGFCE